MEVVPSPCTPSWSVRFRPHLGLALPNVADPDEPPDLDHVVIVLLAFDLEGDLLR
jgi:hypothetical protein